MSSCLYPSMHRIELLKMYSTLSSRVSYRSTSNDTGGEASEDVDPITGNSMSDKINLLGGFTSRKTLLRMFVENEQKQVPNNPFTNSAFSPLELAEIFFNLSAVDMYNAWKQSAPGIEFIEGLKREIADESQRILYAAIDTVKQEQERIKNENKNDDDEKERSTLQYIGSHLQGAKIDISSTDYTTESLHSVGIYWKDLSAIQQVAFCWLCQSVYALDVMNEFPELLDIYNCLEHSGSLGFKVSDLFEYLTGQKMMMMSDSYTITPDSKANTLSIIRIDITREEELLNGDEDDEDLETFVEITMLIHFKARL